MSQSQTEPHHDPEWLEQKYCQEGLTTTEMADEAGVSQPTVTDWMEKHGIQRRSRGRSEIDEQRLREDLLRVAEELDKRPTVNEYGELGEYSHVTVAKRFGDGSWPAAMDELLGAEETPRHHDADWLREMYHGRGMTLMEVADAAGVTFPTISHWMEKHGIERRSLEVDESELWDDLRRVAEELGRRPTAREYDERGDHSHLTVRDRFGPWEDAVDEVLGERDQ